MRVNRTLDEDIRKHRWTHAPVRVEAIDRRAVNEYPVHHDAAHDAIKQGYRMIRALYE
jgi:hypothetical protein